MGRLKHLTLLEQTSLEELLDTLLQVINKTIAHGRCDHVNVNFRSVPISFRFGDSFQNNRVVFSHTDLPGFVKRSALIMHHNQDVCVRVLASISTRLRAKQNHLFRGEPVGQISYEGIKGLTAETLLLLRCANGSAMHHLPQDLRHTNSVGLLLGGGIESNPAVAPSASPEGPHHPPPS